MFIHHQTDENKVLAEAVGNDLKGKVSIAMYIAAIPLVFVSTWISGGLYAAVAIIWLIPDRRIEKKMEKKS